MTAHPCLGTAGAAAPAFGERWRLQGVTAAPWCGRAGLHSPNLLLPDRITMPARWGIMAGVCLRYKGTELSHEVILISYALTHGSACQPALGWQWPPLAFAEPGRAAGPSVPQSLLEHHPCLPSAWCPQAAHSPRVAPAGAVQPPAHVCGVRVAEMRGCGVST